MTIQFDDGAADALVASASASANALRGQGGARRTAAENAADEFSGGYAQAFEAVCAMEAQDRGRLAGVLDDLAVDVGAAKVAAAKEKQRLSDLAAWEERDELWRGSFEGIKSGGMANPDDPKPTDDPVAPPTVSAAFQASQRPRAGASSTSGGSSSADPAALRAFVAESRGKNTGLAAEANRLGNAWAGFTASCSWVRLGSATFLDGFTMLLMENEADGIWLETVAEAFELAGGGTIEDQTLDLLWEVKADPESAQAKIDEMTPAQRKTVDLFNSILQAASDQAHPPEDPLGLLAWALTHVANGGEQGAKWFTRGVYGRLAPRVNGRFAPYASTLRGRGLQARDPKNWTAKPGKAGEWAKWSKAGKWAGRGSGALGFVVGGIDQWEMDQGKGYDAMTQSRRIAFKSVGTGGGSLAGAAGGAWAGAAIGSFAGPVGTVVGGIVGGLIGGLAASGIGSWAANQANEYFEGEPVRNGGR